MSLSEPRTPGRGGVVSEGKGGIADEAVAIQADVRMRVTMNGVVIDVTDISRNFRGMGQTSLVGGHTSVYQRRNCLIVEMAVVTTAADTMTPTRQTIHPATPIVELWQLPANCNIVEYNSNSSVSTSINALLSSASDRGGRSRRRFGPRRDACISTIRSTNRDSKPWRH